MAATRGILMAFVESRSKMTWDLFPVSPSWVRTFVVTLVLVIWSECRLFAFCMCENYDPFKIYHSKTQHSLLQSSKRAL